MLIHETPFIHKYVGLDYCLTIDDTNKPVL
jgi:hypothetical protein